jgi:methoxymalonate biosynthesis acyl carrier protein
MATETIIQKVHDFIGKYVKRELRFEDDIFKSGFVNSLFAMQLVMFVEKEFNVKVENADLDLNNFRSISNITNFVERKKENN